MHRSVETHADQQREREKCTIGCQRRKKRSLTPKKAEKADSSSPKKMEKRCPVKESELQSEWSAKSLNVMTKRQVRECERLRGVELCGGRDGCN